MTTAINRRELLGRTGAVVSFALLPATAWSASIPRPPVARVAPVTETLFGTTLTDNYRWMETATDPDWMPFLKGQDATARAALAAIPGRDALLTRTFCHESARGPGEKYYRNHCVAFDRLQRSDDSWVFTSRSFQYLWLDTSPFSGDGFSAYDSQSPIAAIISINYRISPFPTHPTMPYDAVGKGRKGSPDVLRSGVDR